jgi:DnaJ-class molecular chaperone
MTTCAHCGGSGIQRVSEQRFRTCLHCLGNGENGRGQTNDSVLRFPQVRVDLVEDFSAAVSSSAAR